MGRGFQAQLWKSDRIHFASSDLTTVLWRKALVELQEERGYRKLLYEPAHGALGEPCLPRKAQPGWSPNNIAPTAADSLVQFRREITAK